MRPIRHRLAVLVAVACALGACSDDKPAKSASTSDVSTDAATEATTSGTSGGVATQPPAGGGDLDCPALKDSLTNMIINWQVVIGLTNSPSSEWATIPIGSITQFGDQLAVATAGLASDPDAAEALAFMSGANDIVVRGIGGDDAAQADLAAYLGPDTAAIISKQVPISIAYGNVGCE